jgi:hypothetical protein
MKRNPARRKTGRVFHAGQATQAGTPQADGHMRTPAITPAAPTRFRANCVISESRRSLQAFAAASFFAKNRFPLFRTMP